METLSAAIENPFLLCVWVCVSIIHSQLWSSVISSKFWASGWGVIGVWLGYYGMFAYQTVPRVEVEGERKRAISLMEDSCSRHLPNHSIPCVREHTHAKHSGISHCKKQKTKHWGKAISRPASMCENSAVGPCFQQVLYLIKVSRAWLCAAV